MNFNDMTVSQLRELATERGISGRSKMKKAELVAAIEAADVAENAAREAVMFAQANPLKEVENFAVQELTLQAAHIEEGIERDVEAGTYSFTNEVAILRDAPGRAIVTAAFDGRTVGGSIVRIGRRYMLTAGLITIKANSLNKVAKLFAKRLGFHADVIDIDRTVC